MYFPNKYMLNLHLTKTMKVHHKWLAHGSNNEAMWCHFTCISVVGIKALMSKISKYLIWRHLVVVLKKDTTIGWIQFLHVQGITVYCAQNGRRENLLINFLNLLPILHRYTLRIFLSLLQDSLLASPIILDLVILTELCQRVTVRPQGEEDFQSFHSVLALLSFLCKAPLVPSGTPVVNAFFRQRACIENIMRYGQVSLPRLHYHTFSPMVAL